MDSLAHIFISGAPLSAAKGIGPRLPGLISLICSLFVVLPVLQAPIHYYVGPTIDGIVVKPLETKSFTPTLTLPPPPPPVLPTPITALPYPPSPSRLGTTGCVFLVFAGVAAGAGIVLAAKGGGPGKPPNRPGASSSRRKKTKRPHEAPRGPADDGGGGPPDEDPPPPPPPPGNGQADKVPKPPNAIDLRIVAFLIAFYLAFVTAFWRTFPSEFAQLTRNAKRLLGKARFDPNDREFQLKLREMLRRWLRQAHAAPMAPPIRDVVVARAVEMEQVSDSREWWALVVVIMLAGATIRWTTQAPEQLIIAAPDVVRPIVNTPGAINVVEQPVAEEDAELLPVDDADLAVVDAEVVVSGLDDGEWEEALQELEVKLGGQEDGEVEMTVEEIDREETFLGLPDAVPVAIEADIERGDGEGRGIESESEKQPNPVDPVGGGRDENLGLEETQIVPEAVREAEESKGTTFQVPEFTPVDLKMACENVGSDGEGNLEEADSEAIIYEDEGDEKEEKSLQRLDSTPVDVKAEGALLVMVDEEEETESPDEVSRRKLNAEGKRPEMATEVISSTSTESCALISEFLPSSSLDTDSLEIRKANVEADGAYARKVATDDGSLDAQWQPAYPDYPVASSSRLPDASPPSSLTLDLDRSWLSDSKVQEEIQEAIERQRAHGDCDRWRLHTEPQGTDNEHHQEHDMATQKEEAVDTFCSQAKNVTPEDLFVAAEKENSFFPSTPAPHRKFNPSAQPFFPSAKKTPTPIVLRPLPFWAPNTTPAAVIKPPPTAAEKKAAKLARRAARRAAAALLTDDTPGNGSSLEINPFMVGSGLTGPSIYVGSLFQGETAQAQVEATAQDAVERGEDQGTRFKEKGVDEARTTPLSTSTSLNPTAIAFFPPTRPVRVEHDGPTFWSPLRRNPIAIVVPLNKKERRRLRALALQGSISSNV